MLILQSVGVVRNRFISRDSKIPSAEFALRPIDTFPIRIQERCVPAGGALAMADVSVYIPTPRSRSLRPLRIRIRGHGTGPLQYRTRQPAPTTTSSCRLPAQLPLDAS